MIANISANGTTVLSTNGCKLQTLSINTKGAASNTVKVYDDVSAVAGNLKATIDSTSQVGTIFFGANGATFKNGLTIVVATGTAPDMTVVWNEVDG